MSERWRAALEMSYCLLLVNRRSISRLVAFGAALLVPLVPAAGITAAQTPPAPPAEAYPPAAVSNVIDPFICGTTTLNGVIGAVQAGSTVTVELMRASGPVLATQTVTARADGLAIYSIPVPPNSSGDIVIRATGTYTTGQPFTIETSGFVPACPAGVDTGDGALPATGSSGIDNWLRGGALAVGAGVVALVVAMRRRRPTVRTV